MKLVYIKAFLFWIVYTLFLKGALLWGVTKGPSSFFAFLINMLFASIFGTILLYLFSHEDFFKFARRIEKDNSKQEKRMEGKLKHFGKLTTTFLIGVLGGPLFGALAMRFLLPKFMYKYPLIAIIAAISAAFWLSVARGVIIWRLPF